MWPCIRKLGAFYFPDESVPVCRKHSTSWPALGSPEHSDLALRNYNKSPDERHRTLRGNLRQIRLGPSYRHAGAQHRVLQWGIRAFTSVSPIIHTKGHAYIQQDGRSDRTYSSADQTERRSGEALGSRLAHGLDLGSDSTALLVRCISVEPWIGVPTANSLSVVRGCGQALDSCPASLSVSGKSTSKIAISRTGLFAYRRMSARASVRTHGYSQL